MNNLAYTSQDPNNVAPKIEEILRKDLGIDGPLPYSVYMVGNDQNMLGSIAQDTLKHLFGGSEKLLFTVSFELNSPRKVKILVQINRQGVGCHAGAFLFSAPISKAISGSVTFEEPKTFGSSKFIGDNTIAAKLNGSKDLLKAMDKFARVKSDIGGGIRIPRTVELMNDEDGTVLMVNTLGRPVSMGFSATSDAKDFFNIVNMVETLL